MTSDMASDNYRKLLREALDIHSRAPYRASRKTPIHRWFLIPESSSLALIDAMLEKVGVDIGEYAFIFDPFSGSGTTALYSTLSGINFLGGDKLADLVMATMAKSKANSASTQEIMAGEYTIKRYIQQHVRLNNVFVVARRVQNLIINLGVSLATKFILLALVYSSLRETSGSAEPLSSFENNFFSSLKMATEDLSKVNLPASVQSAIYCGDCCCVDFGQMLLDMQDEQDFPAGILMTSPTFVVTSQVLNRETLYSHLLATDALTEFNLLRKYEKHPLSLRDIDFSSADNYVSSQPEPVRDVLYALACALLGFRQITHSPSLAIIEFENAFFGTRLIELDLMICHLAHLLGFMPYAIYVTHYLDEVLQTPVYYRTRKRGGFVVLQR